MKHLKKFNESKDINYDQIVKLCDEYLAYLKDDGFNVHIEKDYLTTKERDVTGRSILKDDGVIIKIRKTQKNFKWTDVKYDFITFLEMLISNYKLKTYTSYIKREKWIRNSIRILTQSGTWAHFTADEVINDLDILDTFNRIVSIEIKIVDVI